MRHFLLFITLTSTLLFAAMQERYVDNKLLASGMKIIDVRTPGEWKETGLLKGSIPIMFFDERGGYNVELFMSQLKKHIKGKEQFALICRSGSRSRVVGDFLSRQYGYDVINLQGGIKDAIGRQMPIIPYTNK